MIKKIYGVNIAVKNLKEATATYEKFFGVKSIPIEPNFFAFPGLEGREIDVNGFHINLIASTAPDTSVAAFLEKRGEGLFLLSTEVDDLESETAIIKEKGYRFLLDKAAEGAFGKVNFIHPKSMAGVQMEVYEQSDEMRGRAARYAAE